MTKKKNDHLEKAKEYITVAESGDSKKAAYEKAADEILVAMAEDPTLTQTTVAAQIGKGQHWVSELLGWRQGRYPARDTPFARQDWNDRKEALARQVPTRTEDKIEMVEKLLADPEIAKEVVQRQTIGARHVNVALKDREAEWDRRQKENTPEEVLLPIEAQVPFLVQKLQNIHADFRAVLPDLVNITNQSDRDTLIRMVRDFQNTLEQWVAALTDRPLATVHEIL